MLFVIWIMHLSFRSRTMKQSRLRLGSNVPVNFFPQVKYNCCELRDGYLPRFHMCADSRVSLHIIDA